MHSLNDWLDYSVEEGDEEPLVSIERHLRTGRPLDANNFIETLENKLGRVHRPGKPGPKPVCEFNSSIKN